MLQFRFKALAPVCAMLLLILSSGAVRASAQEPPSLRDVRAWACQLQGLAAPGAVEALAASQYDLLVLEPTRTAWSGVDPAATADPESARHFDTRGMVRQLKATSGANGRRKLVLAYLDIGQAEDWRWYWTWSRHWRPGAPFPGGWPSFMAAPDPDGWDGNYVVTYWDPAWKDIVLYGRHAGESPYRDYVSMLDQVLTDEFDGVYLDWVEAFEHQAVIAAARRDDKDPQREMLQLLREIRAYAVRRNPQCLIIQQNGAALAQTHPEAPAYVDAIAQEGVWRDGEASDDWDDPRGFDLPTPAALTAEYHANLQAYQAAGKPVFICDYALRHAPQVYAKAQAKGYIPYVSRKALSQMTSTPPHFPKTP